MIENTEPHAPPPPCCFMIEALSSKAEVDTDLARCEKRAAELDRDIALAAAPDYIALGPIYETKLKVMPWKPQGLDRLGRWKAKIGEIPLVGIAGITVERAQGVLDAGADSAAVITDFITHDDPEARIGEWLAWAATARAMA